MTNYTTCNKKCITWLIYTLLSDGPLLYLFLAVNCW